MKKILALILSATLLLSLLIGCGKGEPQGSEERSSAPAAAPEHSISDDTASIPSEIASAEASESSAEEMAEPTGAVIPAEECQAKGSQQTAGPWSLQRRYGRLPGISSDHHRLPAVSRDLRCWRCPVPESKQGEFDHVYLHGSEHY